MTRRMRGKLLVVFVVFAVLLFVLIGWLIYIERVSGARYERIVLNQQQYDSNNIPFKRGDILDAKGIILATSVDVYNLVLDSRLLNRNDELIGPTIRALVGSFPDLTEEEIRSRLTEYPNSPYQILRRRMPYESIQAFVELQVNSRENLSGVWFEKEYIREYPYDSLANKVLGFTTAGNVGIGGVEDFYNRTLNGTDGRQFGYMNTDDVMERTIRQAENGNTLVTNIDRNIQLVVEEKIREFMEAHQNEVETGPGAKNLGVILQDVNTGAILAMADNHPYNLNSPFDLSEYYSPEDVARLEEEERIYNDEQERAASEHRDPNPEIRNGRLDALDQIWQNFSTTYTYEPGSTVKPLTVSTGLSAGTLTGNETYFCRGYLSVGGFDIRCTAFNVGGHGLITVEQSIMYSCNVAMMEMAASMGAGNFTKYQNIFNIGLRTNIDLPGEARTDTLVRRADEMRSADLATNAFGQNFNLTMVQLASAYASVVNGGLYYQPQIVSKVVDARGNTMQQIRPTLLKQTISREDSEKLKQYLHATVENGTATRSKVPGYSMGGKTGTAEKLPRGNRKYVVSFVGHVPADHPQVMIYVVIDEPNVADQSVGGYAQIMTREILAAVLPYLNIFPDEPLPEGMEEPDPPPPTPVAPTEPGEGENLDIPDEEQINETEPPAEPVEDPAAVLPPDL